jgi:hypothetical protein
LKRTSTKLGAFLSLNTLSFLRVLSSQRQFLVHAYYTRLTLYTPNSLAMKLETNSKASVASSGKKSCSSCKASRKHLLSRNLGHESGPSPVKIMLRVQITCEACKDGFKQLALRKARAYWTKKNLQNWAESTSSFACKPIGFAKRYLVRFRRGTTLKLRNGAKVSTLRVPNRWTSAN